MLKKKQEKEIEDALSKVAAEEKEEQKAPIDEKEVKIVELTDLLQRVQADFINYKKRAEKEKLTCQEYGNADLIKKLLPVLDSFEQALKNTEDSEKFRKGMEMIHIQFLDVLNHEGLCHIDAQGKKFDPYKHEVLMKENSDKDEDTILDELQKGYQLKGKILRHSKVKISGGKNADTEN